MFNHSVTIEVLPCIMFCTWFHEVPVVQYFFPGPVDVLRSDGDCVAGGVVVFVPDHLEEGADWDVINLVDNLERLNKITSKSSIL